MGALTAGIHESVAAEDYHADPCETPSLSSSIAHVLCSTSPLHAWAAHPRLNPDCVREDKTHFDVGDVAHALLLRGEDTVDIVDAHDWRTKAAQEARDAARDEGRVPLLAHQAAQVAAMLAETGPQLDRSNARPRPFTQGRPEVTLTWEDTGGVICRARLDWLRDDLAAIDDFKTTTNANPEQWSRRLFDHGCHIQAAFYLRGVRKLTGATPDFRFVVQEKTPPYALTVMGLTPAALELGRLKVEYAVRRWAECLETGDWPGYPTEVCYAECPAWESALWLEREEREAA